MCLHEPVEERCPGYKTHLQQAPSFRYPLQTPNLSLGLGCLQPSLLKLQTRSRSCSRVWVQWLFWFFPYKVWPKRKPGCAAPRPSEDTRLSLCCAALGLWRSRTLQTSSWEPGASVCPKITRRARFGSRKLFSSEAYLIMEMLVQNFLQSPRLWEWFYLYTATKIPFLK